MNFARSKCDRRVTQGVMRQRGFSLRLGNQRLPRQAKIRSASYQPRSRCAIQPSRLRTAISASRALLLIHRESPFRKNGNPRRRIPAIEPAISADDVGSQGYAGGGFRFSETDSRDGSEAARDSPRLRFGAETVE